VRSYVATADFERFSRHTDAKQQPPVTHTLGYGIGWARGQVGLFHYRGESSTPATPVRTWIYREFESDRKLLTPPSQDDRSNLRFAGFQWLYRVEKKADGWLSLKLLVLPLWSFLLAAIPPAVAWRRQRRARAARAAEVQQPPPSSSRGVEK
jgi:hypothetical protein